MHPQERAFLETIIRNPTDDVSRLVMADFLDETACPERAEFIRLDIELAQLAQNCTCGLCVGERGGGQCTNGGGAAEKQRNRTKLFIIEYGVDKLAGCSIDPDLEVKFTRGFPLPKNKAPFKEKINGKFQWSWATWECDDGEDSTDKSELPEVYITFLIKRAELFNALKHKEVYFVYESTHSYNGKQNKLVVYPSEKVAWKELQYSFYGIGLEDKKKK